MAAPETPNSNSISQNAEANNSKSFERNMFVSVIIPVFNDQERLRLCLEALERQTYPRQCYEIIVVDNASVEDIKDVVNEFSQVKYAFEPQPGSYAARNKGISQAKGEVIAFTDSDCIPDVDWIQQGVNRLQSIDNCGLVAGRIDLFFRNPEHPTAVEIYESIEMNFSQEENIEKSHFGVTANLFTFKHVIDKVGCFNCTLKSGGDREWGQRVFEAGYQQIYANDVLISHPARHSFSQLRKRVARFTGGQFDMFMSRNPTMRDFAMDLVGTFKPPFRSFYRIWTNDKLCSLESKLQFVRVMLFARYVVISEKMSLYLGGQSKRE